MNISDTCIYMYMSNLMKCDPQHAREASDDSCDIQVVYNSSLVTYTSNMSVYIHIQSTICTRIC